MTCGMTYDQAQEVISLLNSIDWNISILAVAGVIVYGIGIFQKETQ